MKFIHVLTFLILLGLNFVTLEGDPGDFNPALNSNVHTETKHVPGAVSLYGELKGDIDNLPIKVFKAGYSGYQKLLAENKLKNIDILSIIDFTRASKEKRLWVIDLKTRTVLFHDLVAHGRNSGTQYARKFSNIPNTNMSSLGFYVTGNTYIGKHGLSLRLDGMEKEFNGNARKRAIVMHPASYVSDTFIKRYGRIGRSFGCPSIPANVSADIIKTVKEGSVLFIYYPDPAYLSASRLFDPSVKMVTVTSR